MDCAREAIHTESVYGEVSGTTNWQQAAALSKTLSPQSTACDKGDAICTTQGCNVSFDLHKKTVAMCTIVKDEEPYIDEFVDYHYALG